MKIGLCGTISVGKTTLVHALKQLDQFKDYETATERSLELMKPNIITDRTIYDVCAFTLSAKSIGWYEKRQFPDLFMNLRNEYDVIIYVSPEGVEIEDNGVRTTDAEYRKNIDITIQEMLIEYPPSKLIKIKGSTEERINTIISQLS